MSDCSVPAKVPWHLSCRPIVGVSPSEKPRPILGNWTAQPSLGRGDPRRVGHSRGWIAWHTPRGTWWHRMTIGASPSLIPVAATWVGMGILGGVVLTTHILRLWVWRGGGGGGRGPFHPPPAPARGVLP